MNSIGTSVRHAYIEQGRLADAQYVSHGLGPAAKGWMLERAAERGAVLRILREGGGEQVLLTHEPMSVLMLITSSWL